LKFTLKLLNFKYCYPSSKRRYLMSYPTALRITKELRELWRPWRKELGSRLMTDTHRQLLDKIITIQSDERPPSSYEDTDTYRKTLADASVMLEDEIEKIKSRIA
jgi:cysteinyl-tRNA synthetase